jgi:predicted small secreted protein
MRKMALLLVGVTLAATCTGCNAVSIVGNSLNVAGWIVSMFA